MITKKYTLYKLFLFILMALCVPVFFSGCAKPRKRQPPPAPAPLTLKQIRKIYVVDLEKKGVQVIQLGETMRFVLLSDDLFNVDSANLQPHDSDVLRTLAALMSTYEIVSVKVTAYTDDTGLVKRQQALTTRQAQVVASYLWSQGIDARLEYAIGKNQKNPVAWNATAIGRRFNRRVEVSFRFYPKSVPYT